MSGELDEAPRGRSRGLMINENDVADITTPQQLNIQTYSVATENTSLVAAR